MLADRRFYHTVRDLRLHFRDFLQTTRPEIGFSVPHNRDWIKFRLRVIVSNGSPASNVLVWRSRCFHVGKGSQEFCSCAWCVYNSAAPDTRRWVCFEIEASDYAEVVLAAFESCEEILPRCCISVHNSPACKDNFEVQD